MMRHLPATGHPMDMLQTSMASLGMFYPSKKYPADSNISKDIKYIRNITANIIRELAR